MSPGLGEGFGEGDEMGLESGSGLGPGLGLAMGWTRMSRGGVENRFGIEEGSGGAVRVGMGQGQDWGKFGMGVGPRKDLGLRTGLGLELWLVIGLRMGLKWLRKGLELEMSWGSR